MTDDACDAGGGVQSNAAQDDCSKSGVAAISQQASDQWLVTAGLKRGTCTVRFDSSTNGSDEGHTVLRIRNDD